MNEMWGVVYKFHLSRLILEFRKMKHIQLVGIPKECSKIAQESFSCWFMIVSDNEKDVHEKMKSFYLSLQDMEKMTCPYRILKIANSKNEYEIFFDTGDMSFPDVPDKNREEYMENKIFPIFHKWDDYLDELQTQKLIDIEKIAGEFVFDINKYPNLS